MRRMAGRGLRIHERKLSRLHVLLGLIGRGSISSNSSSTVEDEDRLAAEDVVEMDESDDELSSLERSVFVDDIVLSVSVDWAWTRMGMLASSSLSTGDSFKIDFDCLSIFSKIRMSGTGLAWDLSETRLIVVMGLWEFLREWAARLRKPV